MHVRINTLHGDKGQVDAAVEFVEGTARPAVEAAAGCRGLATLVDREAGVTFVASYWESADAMRDSEPVVAEARERAGAVGGGDVTVERYEVAIARRLSKPAPGAPTRMLRSEQDPATTDESIAVYRDELLPQLLAIPGLCSVQLVVDRESGKGMSITAWTDDAAVAGAQEALERLRAVATDRLNVRFTGVDSYTMVNSTVRME